MSLIKRTLNVKDQTLHVFDGFELTQEFTVDEHLILGLEEALREYRKYTNVVLARVIWIHWEESKKKAENHSGSIILEPSVFRDELEVRRPFGVEEVPILDVMTDIPPQDMYIAEKHIVPINIHPFVASATVTSNCAVEPTKPVKTATRMGINGIVSIDELLHAVDVIKAAEKF